MPVGFRPVAKAIIGLLIPLIGVLVVVGVLDVEIANKITVELVALATALGVITGGGVYATRNS